MRRPSANGKTMSKTSTSPKAVAGDMRADYRFDYRKSRPNRFASRMQGNVVAVVLEPDVAEVFDTSESVNQLLRSVISAIPAPKAGRHVRSPRRNPRMEPSRR